MNLKQWRETTQHSNQCAAHSEGQLCCLDKIPNEIAEQAEVKFTPWDGKDALIEIVLRGEKP